MNMTARRLNLVLVAAGFAAACSGGGSGTNIIDPPDTRLQCSIPEELMFQGQVRDGIPSLTNPEFSTAGNAEPTLTDDERVVGVVVNGVSRAYPLAVMRWHEIVNDTLGGAPILMSYCPLTASAIVFNPVVDGAARNFGVSGLLFENNLIMYDRQKSSLWVQMLLGSQCGPDRGKSLERLPSLETTWGNWKILHPETTVLTFNTGFIDRDYNANPYADYHRDNGLFYPSSFFSQTRAAKEFVFGVFDGSDAVVFPFGTLGEPGTVVAVNDSIGDTPFVVQFYRDEQTAIGFDRRVNGQALTITVQSAALRTFQDAETGTTWNALGEAIAGPLAGSQLRQLEDSFMAYWFAWAVYFPTLRLVT